MAIVCPSCDHEPPASAGAGVECPACGEKLVSIVSAEALIGTEVDGRFLISSKLGEGGMGVVYRATQKSVGREIALKLLDKRFESDVAAVKRFFREAKVASSLSHPKTVSIFDFGQSSDGRLYIAMELVHGRTLHDELAVVGPMSPDRVCAIGLQLCEAVEAAHAMSIVHRDLKLENVMLLAGTSDSLKVLDFGLARSLADPSMRATSTGVISGTPRYMAPEVLSGADPTAAQDIYAIGVILGELAHGAELWDAPTFTALFTEKLTSNEGALSRVPLWLRPLIDRIIDLEPLKRPTLAEVRAELVAIATEFAAGTLHLRSQLTLDLDPVKATQPVPVFPDHFDTGSLVAIDELEPRPAPAPEPALPSEPVVRFTSKPSTPPLSAPSSAALPVALPDPAPLSDEPPARPTPVPVRRVTAPVATSTVVAPRRSPRLAIAIAAVVVVAVGAVVAVTML